MILLLLIGFIKRCSGERNVESQDKTAHCQPNQDWTLEELGFWSVISKHGGLWLVFNTDIDCFWTWLGDSWLTGMLCWW
jgi:hypothetical protein